MMRDEFRAFEWLSTYRDSDGRQRWQRVDWWDLKRRQSPAAAR